MRAHEITGEKPRGGYQAFEISAASRSALAAQFPPKFSEFIGHHITYKMPARSTDDLPENAQIRVVGYACNEEGIEALVVEVNSSTQRPDGKTYHITWSLDRSAGFKPVKSNELIATRGYSRIEKAINITATAKFF
jgi:hypothetical protein